MITDETYFDWSIDHDFFPIYLLQGGSGDDGVEVATVGDDDDRGITSLKRYDLFTNPFMIQNLSKV